MTRRGHDHGRLLVVALACCVLLGAAGLLPAPVAGGWKPSEDLTFRVTIAPDTVTIGDPIAFELAGSGPAAAQILLPELADSIGAFTILDFESPRRSEASGRLAFSQSATLTLYRPGWHVLPALPLLAIAGTDTLVAYGPTPSVFVRSLLPDDPSLQNPQTALAQLKDVKGVVAVEPSRWWMWILGAAALGAAAFFLYRYWRRRRRTATALPAWPAAKPLLAPEVEFETGLRRLQPLLEQGEVKEYYVGLSLLLRTYIERRYRIPATEATRTELLVAIADHPHLDAEDERWLAEFMTESDLVKFARLDRLLAEAQMRADGSLQWVRETTRREAERARSAHQDSTMVVASERQGAPDPATPNATVAHPPASGGRPRAEDRA